MSVHWSAHLVSENTERISITFDIKGLYEKLELVCEINFGSFQFKIGLALTVYVVHIKCYHHFLKTIHRTKITNDVQI